jgi:hypothetical protein
VNLSHRRLSGFFVATLGIAAASFGCRASPQEAFWSRLIALCNNAYEGRVIESSIPDSSLVQNRLIMYVSACGDSAVRIPFLVGDDASRTWIVTRTADGLQLKHEHVHADGSEDDLTGYGGATTGAGEIGRQDFPADTETARLLPAAARNVWTLEVIPDEWFAYSLRREGTDRRIRIEFDLSQTVTPPAAPHH